MTDPSSTAPAPRKGKWLLLALALCLLAGGGAYWYKAKAGEPKQDAAKNRPLPVVLAEAKTRDVEVFLTSLGTVTSQNTVTVKSRVDGQLMRVLFREGQMVRAGELLLVIDPRPFQVQLAQAEGQLKRDVALLENAKRDLARYADLMAQGAIARQTYDTQLSLVHQYEGTVAADRATADSARLQITFSNITAPISGQVGLRQVDPGNMVRSSDSTGLLVVNQIAPINVTFTLAEDQLPGVLAKLRAGEKLRVDAYDREQSRKLASGELASLDNQIDTGTGTLRLKAVFKNEGNELYPNQFVNAKLLLETLKDAVVVPTAAVQRGQQGAYLYVLAPDGASVSSRQVSVGETSDGESVVLKGLSAGEKVVVEGAERLRDGAKVEVMQPKAKQDKAAGQSNASTNSTANAADSANGTAPAPADKGQANAAKPEPAKQDPKNLPANASHGMANQANAAKAPPAAAAPANAANAFSAKHAASPAAPAPKPEQAKPAKAIPANAAQADAHASAAEGQAKP